MEFYDYRPANIKINNLECKSADVTSLPFEENSIDSLSCMHVVEHIGLERYGDAFDPEGDLKAINELKRVLKPSGNLLFVVPIGEKMRIQYNAHRIYTYEVILNYFSDLNLEEFSLITDDSSYIENATKEMANNQRYGCGCFFFKKSPT